jgi:hypothetical protein
MSGAPRGAAAIGGGGGGEAEVASSWLLHVGDRGGVLEVEMDRGRRLFATLGRF